jgi:hypothetical protein
MRTETTRVMFNDCYWKEMNNLGLLKKSNTLGKETGRIAKGPKKEMRRKK